jgi:hypothetical protein
MDLALSAAQEVKESCPWAEWKDFDNLEVAVRPGRDLV